MGTVGNQLRGELGMKLKRMTVVLTVLMVVFFVATPDAYAAKGGKGGGKPGGEDPSCEDAFPGFSFLREGGRPCCSGQSSFRETGQSSADHRQKY